MRHFCEHGGLSRKSIPRSRKAAVRAKIGNPRAKNRRENRWGIFPAFLPDHALSVQHAKGTAMTATTIAASSPLAPAKQPNVVIPEQEAAKRLGVSARTLQRWRDTGDGPTFVVLGVRRIGYRPGDLDAWVEARLTPSNAGAAPLRRNEP